MPFNADAALKHYNEIVNYRKSFTDNAQRKQQMVVHRLSALCIILANSNYVYHEFTSAIRKYNEVLDRYTYQNANETLEKVLLYFNTEIPKLEKTDPELYKFLRKVKKSMGLQHTGQLNEKYLNEPEVGKWGFDLFKNKNQNQEEQKNEWIKCIKEYRQIDVIDGYELKKIYDDVAKSVIDLGVNFCTIDSFLSRVLFEFTSSSQTAMFYVYTKQLPLSPDTYYNMYAPVKIQLDLILSQIRAYVDVNIIRSNPYFHTIVSYVLQDPAYLAKAKEWGMELQEFNKYIHSKNLDSEDVAVKLAKEIKDENSKKSGSLRKRFHIF